MSDLFVLSVVFWKSALSEKENRRGVNLGKRESMHQGKEQLGRMEGRETIVGIYEKEICFE